MRRAFVLLLLLPVVAGCGAKESQFEASDEALTDARTSRVEWRMEGPDKEMPEWPSFSTTGVVDYANNRGEFVVKSKDSTRMEIRALFIGKDSYFGFPVQGKMRWQKDSGYEATGTDRFLPGPGGTSPDRLLDVLIKSSKRIEVLGKKEIRGTPASHYRVHINEKKLDADEEVLFGERELVVDAWIDEDGLARRIRIPFGDKQEPVSVVDLFDFGVNVDVQAPPADEIISEEEFGALLEKECTVVKARENVLCGMFIGSGSTSYETEAEPVPAPEVGK